MLSILDIIPRDNLRHVWEGTAEDCFKWTTSDVVLRNAQGDIIFERANFKHPVGWSENALRIVADKYMGPGENGVNDLVKRVIRKIVAEGILNNYFDEKVGAIFGEELKWNIYAQRMAFNSPVWFNIGLKGRNQQASACFILEAEDSIPGIMRWVAEEGAIFAQGSGAGINLSPLRASCEGIAGTTDGRASGPVSFMRAADASAGTIKSGGKTRRAAKMVVLNADHPDVEEFIRCKADEEKKAHVLRDAGFDMGVGGKDVISIQYQNANNSVRVTDEFMQAVENDDDWELTARLTGEPVRKVRARDLMHQIAQAAWECGDPGMQFDTVINDWHPFPLAGRITSTNPCGEYNSINNSSCNLASIRLTAFLVPNSDNYFDYSGFEQLCHLTIIAQDILICFADFPTEKIADVTCKYRQLGLGYTDLGALLMQTGVPYDSNKGREDAAYISSVMTARSYLTSALLAKHMGPMFEWDKHRDDFVTVLKKHRGYAVQQFGTASIWSEVITAIYEHGARNGQVTLLAPTGTIAFMMDCSSTGIEPELALVATKSMVGGGTLKLTTPGVTQALHILGYSAKEIKVISQEIQQSDGTSLEGVKSEHLPVFQTAFGANTVSWQGHVKMMAAVQPFLSGAISKTVNLPEEATVEDIEAAYREAWRLGVKAIAVYRDNCKAYQPLTVKKKDDELIVRDMLTEQMAALGRRKPPRVSQGRTYRVNIGDLKVHLTVNHYEDDKPCEIFIAASSHGSTIAGLLNGIAIIASNALQYGMPVDALAKAFSTAKFDPAGITDDPDIRFVSSVLDWVGKRLDTDYSALTITVEATDNKTITIPVDLTQPATRVRPTGDLCHICGNILIPSGSCKACKTCGTTTGCS